MTRAEIAYDKFKEGYNCAQAVAIAFADLMGMDEKTVAMLVSGFGGGIGRLREVCGAVSGMVFVVSMLKGYSDPKADADKKELYAVIQKLAGEFERENGSIICRELLGLSKAEGSPVPEARTAEYYKKRPCQELCRYSADLLEKYIRENPVVE